MLIYIFVHLYIYSREINTQVTIQEGRLFIKLL